MSNFNGFVSSVVTTAMNSEAAAPAASPDVLANKRRGRHTITICATGTTYVGGSDVSSANGIKLDAGEKMTIPVSSLNAEVVYAIGSYTLAEYF